MGLVQSWKVNTGIRNVVPYGQPLYSVRIHRPYMYIHMYIHSNSRRLLSLCSITASSITCSFTFLIAFCRSVGRSVARNASSCLSTYLPPVRPRCREGRRHTSQYSILTTHICSERFARPARPISDLLSPITIKKRLLVEYSEFLCDIFPSMLYLHIPR